MTWVIVISMQRLIDKNNKKYRMKKLVLHHCLAVVIGIIGSLTAPVLASPVQQKNLSTVHQEENTDKKRWGILVYHNWMTNNNISSVLTLQNIDFKYGTMNSVDLSYQLGPQNSLRRFFSAWVSTVEIAGNVTQRRDPNGVIYEFDPYLNFRWKNFPWNHYIKTTLSIGDGLSYATGIPLREEQDSTNHNAKRLLNFMVLETGFSVPQQPDLQLVIRVNHRCGAWGLLGAGNLSSNAVGIGLRYLF